MNGKYYRYKYVGEKTKEYSYVCLQHLTDTEARDYFLGLWRQNGALEWEPIDEPPREWLQKELDLLTDAVEKLQARIDFYRDEMKRIK